MGKDKNKPSGWPLLSKLADIIKNEVTTIPGRVNLISDIVLATVFITIFSVNTFERITAIIVSICNKKTLEILSSTDTLTAFILLVGFFVICLAFLYVEGKINKRKE